MRNSNQMTSAVGYASASLCGVQFGLGKFANVARLEIRRPSGIVQELRDIKADRVLSITEPAR